MNDTDHPHLLSVVALPGAVVPGALVADGDRNTMGPDPRPSAHDVFWSGAYRGTDADPRETGWCETCGREVYDGDPDGHRGER